jgi:SSS family solute:Na+ symporter
VIGVAAVTVNVIISGIHGSAWTSVVKDIMVLAVVLFLGLYLPFALYGGIGEMFQAVNTERPEFLTLPAEGQSVPWFISTVLLTALGFYMWPHTFGSVFSAQNARIFRRNAIFMPLYQLIMLFAFFVGFAAILQVPGLEGRQADLSLLRVSLQQFDPWVVGLIGAAGILTAMVPGSMLLMVSATVLSKNVFKVFRPDTSEERVGLLAKALVPVVALAAMAFTLWTSFDLVLLLLLGYSFVTQLFPALLFSLMPNNFVNKWGAGAGVFTGVALVAYLTVFEVKLRGVFPALGAVGDTNIGIVALLVNLIVVVAVSLATRPSTVAGEVGQRA